MELRLSASLLHKKGSGNQSFARAFCSVPGAGIEPACLAALVFETSASTDSAIRAIVCALSEFVRVHHNFRNCASIDSFRERTAKVEKTYDTAKSEIIFVKE